MEPNRKWSVSYTWNQKQQMNWQPYTFTNFSKKEQKSFDDVKRVIDTRACEDLMAKIEMVDRWVDCMLTFPDAERILNKITQQGDRDV